MSQCIVKDDNVDNANGVINDARRTAGTSEAGMNDGSEDIFQAVSMMWKMCRTKGNVGTM